MHARELIARREFLALSIAAGAFAHRGSPAESRRTGHRIFSKGRIGDLSVDNRLVRSATAENAWHESEMTEEGISLYRGLAAGGVGLIITGYMGPFHEHP